MHEIHINHALNFQTNKNASPHKSFLAGDTVTGLTNFINQFILLTVMWMDGDGEKKVLFIRLPSNSNSEPPVLISPYSHIQ